MTNYEDKEYGAATGSPVEGYEFAAPNSVFYRYTSAELDATINGQSYTAVPIQRRAIRSGTQEDDNLDLELELPADLSLVTAYAFSVSPPTLTLTVYRYHEGTSAATDWIIVWKGPVTSFSITGAIARIRVPSIFNTALSSEIPNRRYQAPCNHVLYDERCQVNVTTFKTTTTVTIVTDETHFTVTDDGFADSYLAAGEVINNSTGERRLIVDNVANVITIAYAFSSLAVGHSIELRAGCAHSFNVCNSKFANTINYGGFPYIPSENPFQGEL